MSHPSTVKIPALRFVFEGKMGRPSIGDPVWHGGKLPDHRYSCNHVKTTLAEIG